jgi:carbamate kinase
MKFDMRLELALERAAATFDVLGAESMGQIGYVLALAMQSVGCTAVPILTQVVVDQYSEAFKDPTKFVGPIYGSVEAQALAQSLGYVRSVVNFFPFLKLFWDLFNVAPQFTAVF